MVAMPLQDYDTFQVQAVATPHIKQAWSEVVDARFVGINAYAAGLHVTYSRECSNSFGSSTSL